MEWNFATIIISILDILIMAFVIYKFLMLLKGSRSMQLLKGILILFAAYIVSGWLQLTTVHWLLGKSWSVIILGVAIIFQPELRSALEKLGRSHPFIYGSKHHNYMADTASAIEEAVITASEEKTGMLLVLQDRTGFKTQIETGVIIDAKVSRELLLNIFFKNSPLHDGAAIIKGDRLVAAGCIMPLTNNNRVDSSLGTRHRAALGTSEMSDATIIVVSEETGAVSLVDAEHFQKDISAGILHRALMKHYGIRSPKGNKKSKGRQ
ncbi:MAG: diadenylate cyclase CdaA [Bacillota bacterium]|nr:diadenylate cyclase CdaA [Bacillota bacterium]